MGFSKQKILKSSYHTVPVRILCDVILQTILAAPNGFDEDINNIKYNFKFNFCITPFEQSQDVFIVIKSN
jgi:hypothetical protein